MSIWNPFAFTPTGQAVAPVAPPALRVMDGQATAQQLAHAQDAFYRFCASARLSAVPNPTEIGALPDGSRYRIVVVGPVATMFLWPTQGSKDTFSGVGIPVLLPPPTPAGTARRYLFVMSYRDGQWRVTTPKAFYGGRGLWVSSDDDDYYLTYAPRGAADSNLYWPAHDAPVRGRPIYPPGTVAGPGGIAYEVVDRPLGSAEPSQGGMVALGGGFVQPTLSSYVLIGPGIYLADYAGLDAIKETPSKAVKQTTGYVLAAPVLPPGVRKPFTPFDVSMLRSGARMATPLIDTEHKLFDNDNFAYLSAYPITREISIDTTGAIPAVSVNTVGKEVVDEGLRERTFTLRRKIEIDPQSITEHSQTVNGVTTAVRAIGIQCRRTDRYKASRTFRGQGTVFTGYGWNDQLVDLWVEINGEVEAESVTRKNTDIALYWKSKGAGEGDGAAAILQGMVIQINCDFIYDRASVPEDYVPSEPQNPVSPVGDFDPPLVGRDADFSGTARVRSVNRHRMHTPWGYVDLLNSDYTITDTTAEGEIVWRYVCYIDIVLGVLVFGETRATVKNATEINQIELEVVRYVTVWHRGQTILSVLDGTTSWTVPRAQILKFVSESELTDYSVERTNNNLAGTFDAPYFSLVGDGTDWSYEVAGQTDVNWTTEFLSSEEQRYLCKLEGEAYSSLDSAGPFTASEYTVESALDPKSGGGVVFVKKGAVLHGAWAISPGGVRTPLSDHLAGRQGNPYSPGAVIEAVVSV